MRMDAAAPHLLDGFPNLRSRSPEEASANIGRIFSPHRLSLCGGERFLELRHNRVRLSQLGINVLTYGAPVQIDLIERGDYYMLLHPLRGHASIECAGRSVTLDTDCMGVLFPRLATRMQWSGNCEMVLLEVPRKMFELESGPITGDDVRRTLSLPRGSPPVAAWWQSVMDMTNSLHHHGEQWLSKPRMPMAIEHFLIAGLHSLFHDPEATSTHREALSAYSQRALQKAIDFIHAHSCDRVTVADIASVACVSPRTLELAFRRRYDQSPLAYLRGVQLDRVHEVLRMARHSRQPVQVTDVALANGFTHMGRFAAYYKQRFGISRALTLRDG